MIYKTNCFSLRLRAFFLICVATIAGSGLLGAADVAKPVMAMVLVPGGSYVMGNGSKVSVSPFYLASLECTQAQYEKLRGNNPSNFKNVAKAASCPVEMVSWFDALEFCNALSLREGLKPYYTIKYTSATINKGANGYRLPTDAEWEFAAREGGAIPMDSKQQDQLGWGWIPDNSDGHTHEVGTKAANSMGLYDLYGNVSEWCWDWYGRGPKDPLDPTGPASGSKRVARSVNCYGSYQGLDYAQQNPDTKYVALGFRVARSVSAPTAGAGAVK